MSKTKHTLEALIFKGENQPIEGAPLYNSRVQELAREIEDGETDVDAARDDALEMLTSETFGTEGANDEHNN